MTAKIDSEPLDAEFTAFLKSKKKSTAETYHSGLALWVNFTHLNGQASLDFKRKDTDAKTEKLVMAFQKYLLGLGKSENTAKTLCGAIRGFYSENRLGLLFTKSESKNLSEANRTTTDYLFTKEDLAKMSEFGNLTDKYVCLVGKSLGLRASEFISLTYSTFRGIHLNEDAPIALGEIVTKKERVKAFPFLDSDAQKVVKAILEAKPEAKNEERILAWDEDSLSQNLKRLFEKAHLESGGKNVRFHCLRKYLFDKLSCVMSEEKAKQIIGKKIKESAYLGVESLRECYLRAMPSIIINGNGKTLVKVEALEDTVKDLERQLKAKDAEIEVLRKNQKTQEKMIGKLFDLPTIAREFRNQKEKVPID